MKKPYIEHYKKIDKFDIYIVDGSYIRKNINTQFTNFGQHYRFPKMIPVRELWLDRDYGQNEYKYYIPHMIKEWELMRSGRSYKDALIEADELEWNMRNKGEHEEYKVKKLEDIEGVSVYLVNGEKVRSDCHIDFTEGGHDKVYDFIPDNEIWISDEVSAKERPYILAHEYNERCQMADGEKYKNAHNKASFFERYLRHKVPDMSGINAKNSRHKHKRHGRVNESKSLGTMR